MKDSPFLNITLTFALTIMVGWLAVAGKELLLPIIVVILVVYILSSASKTIRQLPGFKLLPSVIVNLVCIVGCARRNSCHSTYFDGGDTPGE